MGSWRLEALTLSPRNGLRARGRDSEAPGRSEGPTTRLSRRKPLKRSSRLGWHVAYGMAGRSKPLT
jgi:hypothetical protein